jgi:pimeloyl-ACP methyl ester carboxylesterase
VGNESILTLDGSMAVSYDERGAGVPVLLVHAGLFSDWFLPVSRAPELDDFRVVRARRAGYVPAHPTTAHLTIEDHARHCAALIDALDLGSVHLVGHSSSCLVGLQLALDRPDAVRSLVLLEPAPGGALQGPADHDFVAAVVGPAMGAFAGGDHEAAFDTFMRAVGGDDYRELLERRLGPGAWRRAIQESAFFFGDEAQAVQEWSFGGAQASRIRQPALVVLGGDSAARTALFGETVERLATLLSNGRSVTLAGVDHMMPLQNPTAIARLVAEFARAHSAVRVAHSR